MQRLSGSQQAESYKTKAMQGQAKLSITCQLSRSLNDSNKLPIQTEYVLWHAIKATSTQHMLLYQHLTLYRGRCANTSDGKDMA